MSEQRQLLNGWHEVRLEMLLAEALPGFASGERDENGVIQVRMNNVDTGGHLSLDEFIRVPAQQSQVNKYRLRANDVLFNNTNSAEMVGKSALFEGFNEPVVYSNHFTRLRTKPDELRADYLRAWLVYQWHQKTFERGCDRWIGQAAFKNNKLFDLIIPLPPTLAEQQRIAARIEAHMTEIDAARKAAEAELAAAEELVETEIYQIYTQLSNEYGLNALEEYLLQANYGTSVKCASDVQNGFVPVLRIPNVLSEEVNLDELKYGELSEVEIAKLRLVKGDILIVRTNGSSDLVGRCAVVNDLPSNTVFASYLIRLRFSPEYLLPEYTKFMLTHLRSTGQLLVLARSSAGQFNVSVGRLRSAKIPIPSLDKQQEIADRLNNFTSSQRNLIVTLSRQLEMLKEAQTTILQQAFKGEL